MIDIKQIDDELYNAIHRNNDIKKFNEIWTKIKDNEEILKHAIKLTVNKWNTGNTVCGIAISETILWNYDDVDTKIYQELINNIYENKDIARLVVGGAANRRYSFLLMSLWNDKLKLTKSQKEFAVTEAMYKIGTTYWKIKEENFKKELDNQGVTDKQRIFVDVDGSRKLVGQKTQLEHINYIINSFGDEQAHGIGRYDIRYCILRNPNWTTEEKQKLIMDFWYSDKEYADMLDEWEWGIINDIVNCQGEYKVVLDKSYLYEYSYQELLTFYNTKKDTDKIWDEINFCREMHQLRTPYWKINVNDKKKTLYR